MKVLNWKKEEVNLTELEIKVYNNLKESDTMEDCSCNSPEEVSDETEIPMKELRGVISSLVKKGVAYVEELVSGCGDWIVLYE